MKKAPHLTEQPFAGGNWNKRKRRALKMHALDGVGLRLGL
jgi:hypothetical protein